jgi:hypothetical protein
MAKKPAKPKVTKKVATLAGKTLRKGNKKERSLAGEVLRQKKG